MPHQVRDGNRFVVLVAALAVVLGLSIAFGLSSSTGAPQGSTANPSPASPTGPGVPTPGAGNGDVAPGGPTSEGRASELSSADPTALDKSVASEDNGVRRAPTPGAPMKGTWFVGAAGTYLVGRGIPPGTYESAGASDGNVCQWARVKGLSGTKSDILGAGSSTSRIVVTIQKTDGFFQTKDCANWHKIS